MKPKSLSVRRAKERIFVGAFIGGILLALAILAILLATIVATAWPYLRPSLVLNFPNSTDPSLAGYAPAIVGSLWVVGLTLLMSLPLGIGAAIYLEEYAPKSRVARFLQTAIGNLAGVPSVVFGLLGLAVFVRLFDLGRTVIAGALTLTVLVFPYVVITAQEAIRAVPQSLRDGSLAMGSTKLQAIRHQVLPASSAGLLTGAILATARVLGETAPLIVIGAVVFIPYLPYGPLSEFVALPVEIYSYVKLGRDFAGVAAGGIVILLAMLFAMNLVAIIARYRLQRFRW